MNKQEKIFVAGHTGLIGSALCRRLDSLGYHNLLCVTHEELDLTDSKATQQFFNEHRPDYVILAAGRVGGIVENKTFPADFINENLYIQLNVLRSAHSVGVKRLILFGSSCMYPRVCEQPMAEDILLTGKPEPTSSAYALSKLAGLELCAAYNRQYGGQRFVSLIPNSAYGPYDNFDPKSGHVLSALMNRFHEAKVSGVDKVTLWGTGSPRREFVFSDDIADACIFIFENESLTIDTPVNIGVGEDYSIKELAHHIAAITGYQGEIDWDTSKPDGAPRKLLDSRRINDYGWQANVKLNEGLKITYEWYLANIVR
ncbi:GDP-L-fucose synthase family protein [Methylophilus sp. 3sh_L]|uniref:GDP-L-fucose synthase family protein n=1 Tax=Methylophilus sp. 3sh_L TaxID=3377114 RepID=UPI00398F3320